MTFHILYFVLLLLIMSLVVFTFLYWIYLSLIKVPLTLLILRFLSTVPNIFACVSLPPFPPCSGVTHF